MLFTEVHNAGLIEIYHLPCPLQILGLLLKKTRLKTNRSDKRKSESARVGRDDRGLGISLDLGSSKKNVRELTMHTFRESRTVQKVTFSIPQIRENRSQPAEKRTEICRFSTTLR
jgi:hypothetical protein